MITIPTQSKHFKLTKKDVEAGKINYTLSCSCCNTIPMEITDGNIDGTSLPMVSGDNGEKWLIKGEIVLSAVNGTRRDTVNFKQIFTPTTFEQVH